MDNDTKRRLLSASRAFISEWATQISDDVAKFTIPVNQENIDECIDRADKIVEELKRLKDVLSS